MLHVEELLKQLISIPSTSGEENKVCEYVFELLKKEGFNTKKIQIDANGFDIVADLGEIPNLYLEAHLDTVSPHIAFKEDAKNIYGRGACDTKGSAAAMIKAAMDCKQKGIKNFGLLFTVGEETFFDGAYKLTSEKIDLPFIVVGEPTSLNIVNQHFGLLVVRIKAKGKAAHSSKPEEGLNAIDLLLEIIGKIKSIDIYSETLVSLVMINGGTADNIIPERAEATFSFRISPNDHNNYLKLVKKFSNEKIQIDEVINVKSIKSEVPPELDFIKDRRSVKYFTELSIFKKGVVIGPGDIKYAHGPNEQLSKAELKEAVEVYSKIIKNFN